MSTEVEVRTGRNASGYLDLDLALGPFAPGPFTTGAWVGDLLARSSAHVAYGLGHELTEDAPLGTAHAARAFAVGARLGAVAWLAPRPVASCALFAPVDLDLFGHAEHRVFEGDRDGRLQVSPGLGSRLRSWTATEKGIEDVAEAAEDVAAVEAARARSFL